MPSRPSGYRPPISQRGQEFPPANPATLSATVFVPVQHRHPPPEAGEEQDIADDVALPETPGFGAETKEPLQAVTLKPHRRLGLGPGGEVESGAHRYQHGVDPIPQLAQELILPGGAQGHPHDLRPRRSQPIDHCLLLLLGERAEGRRLRSHDRGRRIGSSEPLSEGFQGRLVGSVEIVPDPAVLTSLDRPQEDVDTSRPMLLVEVPGPDVLSQEDEWCAVRQVQVSLVQQASVLGVPKGQGQVVGVAQVHHSALPRARQPLQAGHGGVERERVDPDAAADEGEARTHRAIVPQAFLESHPVQLECQHDEVHDETVPDVPEPALDGKNAAAPLKARLRNLSRSLVVRRAGWTAADQGLSSVSNFALGVVLARSLDRPGFGAFSLGVAAYLLLVAVARALGSSVLQVRFTAAAAEEQRSAVRDATGVPILLGAAAFLPLLALGWILGSETGVALRALALVLPGLLLQDAWRFAFFAMGRAPAAAGNDFVWVVVQFALLALMFLLGEVSVTSAVLAWGAGACAAGVVGAFQAKVVPSTRGGAKWLRRHGDLGLPTLGEFLLISSTTPVTLIILGAVAGLPAAAAFRAAVILLGPLNLVFSAAVLLAVPEAARLYRSHPERLPAVLTWGGAAFAVIALLFGVATVALPSSVGRALVGANWESARPVVAPLALQFAGVGLISAWLTGLRVLEAASEALVVRLVLTPLYLAAAVAGMLAAEATGAALGLALVSGVGAVGVHRVFRASFARAGREGYPSHSPATAEGEPRGLDI